ncbi:MAG: fucose isomerase [Lentisphaerae bacterium]|jgi:L-fucose isomerase-like protein|nr:fucose isomerase [Lentisphaerota bacterium]
MLNQPKVKLAVVGVSRDCFPASLTKKRVAALMAELKKAKVTDVVDCPVTIENEKDALAALEWARKEGVNAACMFLGNFGPEGPTTYFVQEFGGPAMVLAAREENKSVLASDRGDALCGVLNFSYNVGLRRLKVYIPEYPNVTPKEGVAEIKDFIKIARTVIGVKNLKVFGFGPRPYDFLACNAPIQPLFDLGVNVQENSELDLFEHFHKMASRKSEIDAIVKDMQKELGKNCPYPDLLPQLAQFELALMDWYENQRGAAKYAVFADKCWPAFQTSFHFVPCYVNSRLTGRGIPVACEVDMYGAVSEYMLECATELPATLLDINNSVPDDILPKGIKLAGATKRDLYMGFHCGNTCSKCLKNCGMKYQLIMNRGLEGGGKPVISRGTMEGQIKPSETTMFRLQSNSDGHLVSYIAHGEFLDVNPHSFGSIGVAAIPGFARFYRHVLVQKRFPHHGAFGFEKVGKVMFESLKLLGVDDINTPLPDGQLYPGENPFAV